jgi:hypothetical protein
MRLLTITVATTVVLAIAFSQTPRVLAQGHDDGAVGRPLQLDGGPSLGSDNHGEASAHSESNEPSASVRSEKSQTGVATTAETTIRGRALVSDGRSVEAQTRAVDQ